MKLLHMKPVPAAVAALFAIAFAYLHAIDPSWSPWWTPLGALSLAANAALLMPLALVLLDRLRPHQER